MKTASLCLAFLVSFYSHADKTSELVKELEFFEYAEAIERVAPRYPTLAARRSQEGWVIVSFVVSETGDVIDPIVEDSSGIRGFEKASLNAVKRWKYKPAMRNGEPVEQCESRVQLDFRLDNAMSGVSRLFYRRYNNVVDAINSNDIALAEQQMELLSNNELKNMYENAWFWMLDSELAKHIEDQQRELSSIDRALSSSLTIKHLGEQNFSRLILREFKLHVSQSHFSEALDTFEQLQNKSDGELDDLVAQLAPFADKINSLIESDTPITRTETLDADKPWGYKLIRNSFSLTNLKGELDELEVRCKTRRSTYTIAPDVVWTVPESWGECRIYVKGEKDAQFTLVEIPQSLVALEQSKS